MDEQNFIAELIEVGNNFRGRVRGTAEATNLVDVNPNGFDRLNTSLDAFEGVTTLNAQKLGQFIVSSFDGTDLTSPLGTLTGDLCDTGNGMDTILSDVAGVMDLSDSAFSAINTAIFSSIEALGLDTGGLGDLADLSSFVTAVTSFEDMEAIIDDIVTAIESILP